MTATAFRRPPRPPQRDWTAGGAPTWVRHRHDEVRTYRADIGDELDSGETADSVTIRDRVGVTVDSSSVSSAGLVEITVSQGGNGSLTAMVTTSGARELPVPMQWRAAYPSTYPPGRDAYGR